MLISPPIGMQNRFYNNKHHNQNVKCGDCFCWLLHSFTELPEKVPSLWLSFPLSFLSVNWFLLNYMWCNLFYVKWERERLTESSQLKVASNTIQINVYQLTQIFYFPLPWFPFALMGTNDWIGSLEHLVNIKKNPNCGN